MPDPPPPATGWRARTPNALTMARLALAAVFVGVVSLYDAETGGARALLVGAVLFTVAALTDALDGWLARRWRAISVFGRVMDPFADKLLVLGAFIVLAGPGFQTAGGGQLSGVLPWMAVVVLGRELLVTTIRGVYESAGVDFSAGWAGKAKMIVQSAAAPTILLVAWAAGGTAERRGVTGLGLGLLDRDAAMTVNTVLAWVVVLVTAWSAWPYVSRAVRASGELTTSRRAEGGA